MLIGSKIYSRNRLQGSPRKDDLLIIVAARTPYMDQYDVAIVGGGPGGASAAAAAADEGAKTVLFEKGIPREDREQPGPDSTDAAGFIDYWVDIADLDYREIPEEVIHQNLDRAEFISPSEEVIIDRSGMDASYPHFGFTFDRVAMDDWLHRRAREAGATLEVGTGVVSVNVDPEPPHEHSLQLDTGEELTATTVILADGPQRRITNGVLDSLLPDEIDPTTRLGTQKANHIAYQEHREMPPELVESDAIKFWWGAIPGETAYPWVFPNDGNVARIGLTMPIGLTKADIDNPEDYWLVDPGDDELPSPNEYIVRLLERTYPDYELEDFPLVEDRGKRDGTETYPISSTRPIDSPTGANIAVVGGAMGATSAFHEGGDHTAMRTGKIAGQLAARDDLAAYNPAWKDAIGSEVLRNVVFADIVEDYTPEDWDQAFRIANGLMRNGDGRLIGPSISAGARGLALYGKYWWMKRQYRDGSYVQLSESDYIV